MQIAPHTTRWFWTWRGWWRFSLEKCPGPAGSTIYFDQFGPVVRVTVVYKEAS